MTQPKEEDGKSRIEVYLKAPAQVKTVLIIYQESGTNNQYGRMNPSQIRVGGYDGNHDCARATTGGVYSCNASSFGYKIRVE